MLFGESGLSTIAVRLVPALFGIATVWLASVCAATSAQSARWPPPRSSLFRPAHVYISRYFIHESHFVFFTLGIVVAALRYWEAADPVYLMLASMSAALLFATKETAIISVGVLGLIATALAALYCAFEKRTVRLGRKTRAKAAQRHKTGSARRGRRAGAPLERFGGPADVAMLGACRVLIFIFVNMLFLFVLLSIIWEGVADSLKTFKIWAKTGTKDHVHEWHTYLWWLWQEEAPLLFLGACGALLALSARRNRFAIFTRAVGFGILAAYSLIPYKTPWLMLNFTVPLAIIARLRRQRDVQAHRRYLHAAAYCAGDSFSSGSSSAATRPSNSISVTTTTTDISIRYAHTCAKFLPLVDRDRSVGRARRDGKQTGDQH